ncbi:MAG: peptide ABC transporter substrate-binding protein [Gammaproteobacteria bacterium]|nr:peptide ABC transporter substrate-binding protein [Gammaproteobacteria bacterium]
MRQYTYLVGFLLITSLLCSCGNQEQLAVTDSASSDVEGTVENTEIPNPIDLSDDATTLKILYWQAPSILNPYLSSGTKDIESSSLIVEPLARYDSVDGEMVPWLASTIPTMANGGLASDYRSITWNLRTDIIWSDGTPFTADDVVFTWMYCSNEEFGCVSSNAFKDVAQVVAVDTHTVRVEFTKPMYFPYGPFVGSLTPIIQKEQFKDCLGAAAQACTEQNFNPVGTGPFMVEDFKANDVITFVANPNYREEGKPYFQKVIFKGGGEASSAARAVLETGEFDYAWNLQVEPEVLEGMQDTGKGELLTGFGSNVERIMVNQTNNDSSLERDKRSLYLDGTNPHPFLSDLNVRRALSLAIDRSILVEVGYGDTGRPMCNVIPAPSKFVSDDNEECKTQNIEEANRLLDEAGWVRGRDGVREKDGVRLSMLYQTSTNSVRQDTQALVKEWWSQIGVETELRHIDGAVFFGSDQGSPDTLGKFYADVQMYTNNFEGIDPSEYVESWVCEEVPGPHNDWNASNIPRGCSEDFDALVEQLEVTEEPLLRIAIIKQINDYVVQNYWEIPLIWRARVSAKSVSLKGVKMNGWDSELWNVADWYRE